MALDWDNDGGGGGADGSRSGGSGGGGGGGNNNAQASRRPPLPAHELAQFVNPTIRQPTGVVRRWAEAEREEGVVETPEVHAMRAERERRAGPPTGRGARFDPHPRVRADSVGDIPRQAGWPSSGSPKYRRSRPPTLAELRYMKKLPTLVESDMAADRPGWWVGHLARLGVFEGRPGSEWAVEAGALAYRPGMVAPHPDTVGAPGRNPRESVPPGPDEGPLEGAAAALFGIVAGTADWRTPLGAARDCAALFDSTLAACAVHRVAKLSSAARIPPRTVLHHREWAGALEPLACSLIHAFTPRQVANVWWALAKLRAPRSRLAPMLAARAKAFTPEEWASWRPQELANALWAMATLGLADVPAAWQPVFAELKRRNLMTFQTQAVSNAAWAAAGLKIRDDAFLAGIAAATIARISYLSPQSVSNTAWAFNELGFYHSAAYDAAATHAAARMREYKPQEFCNVLYALAKQEHLDAPMFEAVDAECARRERWEGPGAAKLFANQAIANIAWSYAYARWYAPSALPALAAAARDRLHTFGEQEMSNVLWAFAKLGYDPGAPFLAAFSDRLVAMLAADEANAAHAAAGGDPRARARWAAANAAAAAPGRGSFGAQAGANTLWALAATPGGTRLPCFNALAARLSTDVGAWANDRIQVNQMFQALLLVRLEREAAVARGEDLDASGGSAPCIPDAVAARVTRSWLATTSHTMVSVFQEDVSQVLRGLGVAHSMEHTTSDGLFSVDIAVTTPPAWGTGGGGTGGDDATGADGSRGAGGPPGLPPAAPASPPPRVAIEVDGPFHFTANNHSPLGPTKLRHRMLEMLGWTVLSVPFFEYYTLGDVRSRGRYLAAKLAGAGVEVDPARVAAMRGEDGAVVVEGGGGGARSGPAAAVAAAGGALGAGAPLRPPPGGGEPIPSPLGGRAAGAVAAVSLPAPATSPTPRPPPPPITPTMVDAARRAAVAAQHGRGRRARASIGSLTAAQRRQDAAFTGGARAALAAALAYEEGTPYAIDQGLPPPDVRIVLSEGGAAAAAVAAATGGRVGLSTLGVTVAPAPVADGHAILRAAMGKAAAGGAAAAVAGEGGGGGEGVPAAPATPPPRAAAAPTTRAAPEPAAPPPASGAPAPTTRAARETELQGLNLKRDLANLCVARSLPKSGKKAEVIARLLDAEFGA